MMFDPNHPEIEKVRGNFVNIDQGIIELSKNLSAETFERNFVDGLKRIKDEYYSSLKPCLGEYRTNLEQRGFYKSIFFSGDISPQKIKGLNESLNSLGGRLYLNFTLLLKIMKKEISLDPDFLTFLYANVYRSCAENLIRFLEVDILIQLIASIPNISNSKEHKILKNKFRNGRFSLGDALRLFNILDTHMESSTVVFSEKLKNYIDLDLRNAVAHEKYKISGYNFINLINDKVYSSEILSFEIEKIMVLLISFLTVFYFKDMEDLKPVEDAH
ncbi:hypothetical protein HYV84_03480 [Candidatus Woesearchaeota archaeon]|nr:hypothetical protein [Candidatus Woesearchaeota archaeon]